MEATNTSQMAIKLCIEKIVNLAEKGISENKEALIKDSIELTEVLKTYSDESLKAEVDKKVAESIKDLPTKDFLEAKIAQVKTEVAEAKASLETKIAQVRTEVAEAKVDIVKWMVGIAFATVGSLAAIMRFFL